MIKGIRFSIPNNYGKYLYDILNEVDLKKYLWNLSNDEVIVSGETKEKYGNLFDESIITGEELYKKIAFNNYYIINVELRGYNNLNKMKSDITIRTYEDFERSNCEVFVAIFDCVYAELYCKDIKLLEDSYKSLKEKKIIPKYIKRKELRTMINVF